MKAAKEREFSWRHQPAGCIQHSDVLGHFSWESGCLASCDTKKKWHWGSLPQVRPALFWQDTWYSPASWPISLFCFLPGHCECCLGTQVYMNSYVTLNSSFPIQLVRDKILAWENLLALPLCFFTWVNKFKDIGPLPSLMAEELWCLVSWFVLYITMAWLPVSQISPNN